MSVFKSVLSAALIWVATAALAAPAQAAPLKASAIFSSAQAGSQSFLRFYNSSGQAGTATVILKNAATGQVLTTWTSPSIPAGSEQQYFITALETGIASKPDFYAVDVQAGFAGTFQHVLYRPADGTLTNLSTCATGIGANASTAPCIRRCSTTAIPATSQW